MGPIGAMITPETGFSVSTELNEIVSSLTSLRCPVDAGTKGLYGTYPGGLDGHGSTLTLCSSLAGVNAGSIFQFLNLAY
jgi:hypothetical protein